MGCGPCGTGGSPSAASGGTAGAAYTIRLPNGTKVGSYPTQDHAKVALQTTYAGQGTVELR
jgi:hypothetical protein